MKNDVRLFDVDIDTNSFCKREEYGTRAMIYNKTTERILPHPSGVYIEDVPVDPETNNCAFDYEYGDDNGFMKVDILTNKAYDIFKTKQEVITAAELEPDWSLLLDESVVATLPHIANHFDIIRKVKPTSVEELADVLALIRPAKVHLISDYLKSKASVRRRLYLKPTDDVAYFKKSHAIGYALMIVAILNKRQNGGLIQWERHRR